MTFRGTADNAKTVLCTRFLSPEGCRFGDRCNFAHGDVELRNRTGIPQDVRGPRQQSACPASDLPRGTFLGPMQRVRSVPVACRRAGPGGPGYGGRGGGPYGGPGPYGGRGDPWGQQGDFSGGQVREMHALVGRNAKLQVWSGLTRQLVHAAEAERTARIPRGRSPANAIVQPYLPGQWCRAHTLRAMGRGLQMCICQLVLLLSRSSRRGSAAF